MFINEIKIIMRKIIYLLLLVNYHLSFAQTGDCVHAKLICSKDMAYIDKFPMDGNIYIDNNCCFPNKTINGNIQWLKFKIFTPGELNFKIIPNNIEDDLDFVLFKSNEKFSCTNLSTIRCMASGRNLGNEINDDSKCRGITGLRSESHDISESNGCFGNSDSYLKSVNVNKGDSYFLAVSNYTSQNGFNISFTGEFEFDQNINLEDNITMTKVPGTESIYQFEMKETNNDEFKEYYWDFGRSAYPNSAFGPGVHTVLFSEPGKHEIKILNKLAYNCTNINSLFVNVKKADKKDNSYYFGQVFPNPAKTDISIPYLSSNAKTVVIELLNSQGKVINTFQNINLLSSGFINLNVSELPAGVYFAVIKETDLIKILHTVNFVVI